VRGREASKRPRKATGRTSSVGVGESYSEMAAAGRTGLFRGLPGERGQKNNEGVVIRTQTALRPGDQRHPHAGISFRLRPSPHHRSSLQRCWPQSIAQGKMLAKLSLEATSERIPYCTRNLGAFPSLMPPVVAPPMIPPVFRPKVPPSLRPPVAALRPRPVPVMPPVLRPQVVGPGARGTVYAPVALPTPAGDNSPA